MVVWGVRCIGKDCPPSCCLNWGWLFLQSRHFTDVLTLAYLNLWLLVHFIVVTHLLLHDRSHQLVLVQSHALLEDLLLSARWWLDEHAHRRPVAVAVVRYRFLVFNFVGNHILGRTLKFFQDMRQVVRVIQLEGLWKTHTCWRHFLDLRGWWNVSWDSIRRGVTVYPVSTVGYLSLEKGDILIFVSLLLSLVC